MTQPTDDVAKIAAGLTKAQRAAVLNAKVRKHYIGGGDRWVCRDANRVRGPLLAKALVYLAIPMFAWRSDRRDVVLTPLGEQVRAYLIAQEQG